MSGFILHGGVGTHVFIYGRWHKIKALELIYMLCLILRYVSVPHIWIGLYYFTSWQIIRTPTLYSYVFFNGAWQCVSRLNVRGEFAQPENNQHFFYFIGAQAEVNVALGKDAYQSSTHNHPGIAAFASCAVDGNTDGNYHLGTCTHTTTEASPWWIVDLGRHCSISYLRVYNRDILGKFLLP